MKKERFEQIFNETEPKWDGDNNLQGLNIIAKYFPENALVAAEHDKIFSVSLEKLAEVITEEDCIALRKLNWMIDYECLASFV